MATARSAPGWDPGQYLRYADERSRPFVDLMARVHVESPQLVVDLGCGPGTLTRTLAERWPAAQVIGVDSSSEMIEAAAAPSELSDRLMYVCADLRDWQPESAPDVVVSNAAFHWIPDHLGLIGQIAGWVRPGGAFAMQVPANFDAASHTVIHDVSDSPRWRERLAGARSDDAGVAEPAQYLAALNAAGLEPDVWQTTYFHVLHGEDPVLNWIKGTALRPALTALAEADDAGATEVFLAECGTALREAYPVSAAGTVFPFRRTFAVGHRAAA
ncbi:MAG TPA: methyltransferase domain-containing protein [Mycobacteriales bacterium]|nr:methyltransferase domain-containing protein [Mycobacteriales bacterium]